MKEKRLIIAGTGHRPKYCPCKYNEKHPWLVDLKRRLYADLDVGWNSQQIEYVISGMAIGFDTWLAEVCLDIGIPVHAYVPFKGQESKWIPSAIEHYNNILSKCENIVYIANSYSNKAFLDRNKAMVDKCDILFALADPYNLDSGTAHTVEYAKKQNKEIENYWRD